MIVPPARNLSNPSSVVTRGLVLWLDAANLNSYTGSGTTWRDMSGNGNNGTLINGVVYSSNNFGYLSFDGSNEYVNIPSSASINNCLSSDFTYEIWVNVKLTGFSFGKIFAKGAFQQTTGFNGMRYATGTKNVNFQYGNPNVGLNVIDVLSNDVWHHIVMTRIGTTVRFYVDNVLTNTHTGISFNWSSTYPLRISSNSQPDPDDCHQFVGSFRQYSRGLVASEIAQNFQAHRGRYGV